MQSEKPKGFLKNIENIWYHYKYVILVALAALIMFSVAMAQFITKKDPDIFIYHITTSGLTASSQDSFRESMKLIALDYNGDGVITVDFKEDMYIPNDIKTNPNELSSVERFNLELALGECVVYIMDKNFYSGNSEYMVDLSEIFDDVPDFAYDGKAIRLKDLPGYSSIPGLHDFSDDSYLCLRKKRSGMSDQEYLDHIDFFKRLVLYEG